MSEDHAPGSEPAVPEPEPVAPGSAEAALQQGLYVRELERLVESLRADRAAVREELRTLQAEVRPREGLDAVRFEVKEAIRRRVRARREGAPADPSRPGIPLAALPVTGASDVPRWEVAVDILGDVRPALAADPPASYSWPLDLAPGTVASGAVSLRPGAWLVNEGGIELVAELRSPGGELVGTFVLGLDPTANATQRQWVPWRFPLEATGPHELRLHARVPEGVSADYAWVVIGDPRLEVPGLAPRPPWAPTARPAVGPGIPASGDDGRPSEAGAPVTLPDGPQIALLMPVHDPPPGLLDQTIASVLRQTSPHWQLCIVDDGSTDPLVRDRLARAAAEDPRVRLHRHEEAQNISGATNAALALATADFVATLDHDDLLAPDAIERAAAALRAAPQTDVLYSDNDLLTGSRRFSAALKPGWSPDLMRSVMYTLHLGVYRRALVEAVGGWRSAFDGAQDHDLVLRLSERTEHIAHLPRVLYHWRAHAGSTSLAGDDAKPLAFERGRAAIAEHLERTGLPDATVERLPEAGRYRVRYPRIRPVTVVAAIHGDAADGELHAALTALLAALREDDAVLLVPLGAGSAAGAAADGAAAAIGDPRLRIAGPIAGLGTKPDVDGDANGARAGSAAPTSLVEAARGVAATRTAVLMERLVAPASPDAIDELAAFVEAGAAAAGGVVAGPGGRIAAGALAFPAGLPAPVHVDVGLDDALVHQDLSLVSDRLAVRGVVALSSATLTADGAPERRGAAQTPARLAVAALTLAAAERGDRVVWSPFARFEATEPAADALRTWPVGEAAALDRGPASADPFWNPLLWPDRADATVPEAVHENPLLDVLDR